MEAELVDKLQNCTEFSDDLINILTAITRDIHREIWDIYLNRLVPILVGFTTQSKINSMNKNPTGVINVQLIQKTFNDYCLDITLQLLLKLIKFKKDMAERITELYLDHFENQPTDSDALSIFFKICYFSEKMINHLRAKNYVGIFVEHFEKLSYTLIRETESSERTSFMNTSLKNYFGYSSDFYSNLNRYVQSLNMNSPLLMMNPLAVPSDTPITNAENMMGSPDEEEISKSPISRHTQNRPGFDTEHQQGNHANVNQPGSEQSSFSIYPGNPSQQGGLPLGSIGGMNTHGKGIKVPALNLPTSINENANTISRSTRRADPYKSISTNSNRFSTTGLGSTSLDIGPKDLNARANNENNISLYDAENSYFYEDNNFKIISYISAQDKMKSLANQLGEYCLTVDLGCMLAHKRKVQLDQVANMTIFQDVDSIMDIKVDEKLIKEKLNKKRKMKHMKKKNNIKLSKIKNLEIKEVESSRNSEDNSEEESPTGQPEVTFQGTKFLDRDRGKNLEAKKKTKQDLKALGKMLKILANLIYHILKEYDINKLQNFSSLVSSLYLYLSTHAAQEIREKELRKLASSSDYWEDQYDAEFQTRICEGIDNIDNIDRHYEKTLIEQYRAKQKSTLAQNQANVIGGQGGQNQAINLNLNINRPSSEKKTSTGKMNLRNVESNVSGNPKIIDSTLLHFSTTYDNTNSSAFTYPDESIDSIDELNLNQNVTNVDTMLMSENTIYFKILDLFAVLSEKTNELLVTKYNTYNNVGGSTSSNTGNNAFEEHNYSDLHSPGSQSKGKFGQDVEKIYEISNLSTLRYGEQDSFKLQPKGLNVNPNDEVSQKFLKKCSNLFLSKFEKKFSWVLNNLDMNQPFFYEVETEQLQILHHYLENCTSRNTVFEVMDHTFDLLLFVKKQILDLSAGFISQLNNATTNNQGNNATSMSNRIFTPNNGGKTIKTGSFSSKDFQNLIQQQTNQPNSNNTVGQSNFMRSYFKAGARKSQDVSPSKIQANTSEIKDDNPQAKLQVHPGTYTDNLYLTSFIFRQRKLFSAYLGIISRLILRSPKTDVFTLLNGIFISNESWLEVLKLYVGGVFFELAGLIERSEQASASPNQNTQNLNSNPEFEFDKDKISLFIEAKQILEYYNAVLYMCQWIIFKEKLNNATKDPSKKKWKNIIRKILQNLMYLIKPNIGIFSEYLVNNSNLNSLLISSQSGALNNFNLLRIRLLKSIVELATKVFGFNARFSCFLTEEIAGFYIRFAYINFVKLYSHSNNSELNEINMKINEISNKVRRNNPNINAEVENLTKLMRDGSPFTNAGNNQGTNKRSSWGPDLNAQKGKNDEQSEGLGGQAKKNTEARSHQIILSNQYVKLLFAIARNRTDEIKRKFYQYRILEFFSREIDLEFDISQIRERFLRIRNEAKRRFSNADNQNNLFQTAEQEIITKSHKDRTPVHMPQQKQNTPKSFSLQTETIKSPHNEANKITKSTPKAESNETPVVRPKLDLSKLNLGGAKSQSNQAAMDYKKNYEKQYKAEADLKSAKSEESKGKEILKSELKTELLPGDTEESQKPHPFNMQDNSFAGEESMRSQKFKKSDRSNVTRSGRDDREQFDTEEHDTELSRRIQMMHQMQQAKKRPPIPSLNLANTATPSYYGGGIIQNESKPMPKLQTQPQVQQQLQQQPQTQPPETNVVNESAPVGKVQINLASLGKPMPQVFQQETPEIVFHKKGGNSGRAQHPQDLRKLQPKEEKQEPVEKPDEDQFWEQKKVTVEGTEESEVLNQSDSGIISLRQQPTHFTKNLHYENLEGQSIDPEFGGRSPTGKLDISNFTESRMGSMQLQTNKQAPESNTSAFRLGASVDPANDPQTSQNKPKFKIPAPGIGFTNQDPKFAGSPRDVSQKNTKGNDNFSFGANNPPPKKNVPSLKISGIDREQFHKNDYGNYEPHEKEGAAEGDLTKLEKSLNMSNPKMQLLLEGKKKVHSPMSSNPNLLAGKEHAPLNLEELLTENIFYYSERKLRKIYEDDELHVLVLSLMICLLLTPTRGTLDDHYCSQFPINNGKPNILYILHFHLNHPSNQHILPLLLQKMSEINPFPAGQRLLKLLCASFTDTTIYTDWKKIATGAYGTIYECNTNLADPQTVAIKQLSLPKSIYERCVLHDIFTEITCLESFRLDPCITDMYDYGVTDHDYIIVMKKYPSSLKDWRVKQEGNWSDNLPTYMTIFRDILKAISLLHSHNVTHYDLKCDNVLLDYKTNSYNNSKWLNDSEIRITIGDFGECKMFVDEDDEFDLRNRGTEYIKSPEMLTLTLNSKKEADNFDRRKKIGTTRSSDIWSLGCLFYELLTGDFLFFHRDWIHFYIRVTSPSEVLLTEEMLQKIGHNTYLTDFLKYILVRDPQHRPSIDNVLKRFEHIHAILVSGSNYADKYALQHPLNNAITLNFSLESCIENYMELLFPTNETIQEKITLPHLLKHPPLYMKIMDEIHICSRQYFLQNVDKLIQGGITHVVTTSNLLDERNLLRFKRLVFRLKEDQKHELTPYLIASRVMDFLREVFLYRGNLLIIEDDNLSVNSKPDKLVLRTALLFCLTYFFRCSVYETWTLINSQILFYTLPFSNLSLMSNFMVQQFKIIQFLNAFPKVQCICGCATIVLKRQFNVDKNINVTACACSRDSRTLEFSDCPSDGCAEYMRFVKDRYKIQWESLKWAYFGPNDFVIGPKNTGVVHDKLHVQIVMNSEGLQENTTVYPRKSKRSGLNQPQLINKEKWDIYSCKVCQMWLYAANKKDAKYALIMNNLIKKKSNGIMIPQPQFNFKIRTPILRNFKCCELR